MMDHRRHPREFLDEAREIIRSREQDDHATANPAVADQTWAADRHARLIMGEANDEVVDVDDIDERETALLLAISHAATRRALYSPKPAHSPRPEFINLAARGRPGHRDICETPAHRLIGMHSQYGPWIFFTRTCVRCRSFAPPGPDHRELAQDDGAAKRAP